MNAFGKASERDGYVVAVDVSSFDKWMPVWRSLSDRCQFVEAHCSGTFAIKVVLDEQYLDVWKGACGDLAGFAELMNGAVSRAMAEAGVEDMDELKGLTFVFSNKIDAIRFAMEFPEQS